MEELIHGSNLEDSGVLHRLVSEVGIRRGFFYYFIVSIAILKLNKLVTS